MSQNQTVCDNSAIAVKAEQKINVFRITTSYFLIFNHKNTYLRLEVREQKKKESCLVAVIISSYTKQTYYVYMPKVL